MNFYTDDLFEKAKEAYENGTYDASTIEYLFPVLKTEREKKEFEETREKCIYFLESAKPHYASTEMINKCIEWAKEVSFANNWSDEEKELFKEAYNAVLREFRSCEIKTQEEYNIKVKTMDFLKNLFES